MESQLDSLKVELKNWEHAFIEGQGREPTKNDIKQLPEIKKMYKEYSILKKNACLNINRSNITREYKSPRKNLSADLGVTTLLELGPTPQIHGKAISIFEMGLSPIKQTYPLEATNGITPPETIDAIPNLHNSNQEDVPSVKRKLNFTDATPSSSPFKIPTTQYKPNYYGPNSPLKLTDTDIKISISHKSPIKLTPHKAIDTTNVFSYSPSPLVKRPLTKSLLELVREHEAIVEEMKGTEENHQLNSPCKSGNDSDSDFNGEEPRLNGPAKKKRRILRRFVTQDNEMPIKRNIADELIKIKQQCVNEFYGDNIFDQEDQEKLNEEEMKEKDVPTKKTGRKKNKKYNLVSNNFRRLRLPKKNSTRFFGRRRR